MRRGRAAIALPAGTQVPVAFTWILERVVAETLRATDFVGARLFDENAHIVWDLAEVGVPKFAQRSLVSFGFRVAAGIVRQNARPHGFEA